MKNTQKCPKCDSTDILRLYGNFTNRPYCYNGNYIDNGPLFSKHRVFVYVTRYVCGECGFTEEWIDEKKDIEDIKENIKGFPSKKNTPEYLDDDGFDEIPPWTKKLGF